MFDTLNNEGGEWYVIRVISGTEENVRQSLMQRRQAFWLERFILDVFVPTHEMVAVRPGGKRVQKKKNIFPGYILVKMLVSNESWYIVRNTPNVTGFLGAGTVPVPVRGDELEQLKWVLSEKTAQYTTAIKVWNEVTVLTAPFEGNTGMVTEMNESKWTLKINVNLLGQDTPLELNFEDVKLKK